MLAEQCQTCGQKVGDYLPAKDFSPSQLAALPLWNKELAQSYLSNKNSEINALWQAEKDEKNAKWWRDYNEHLQSQKWKDLRAKVLKRANYICEGCGADEANQAHHLNYDRMGDEMLFDLVAVCETCHAKIHLKNKVRDEDVPDKDDSENFPSGDEGMPF